jgi:hydrogenase maturation protein HypF
MTALNGTSIHITGVVQGVGFRPFIYSLAKRFDLNGWVRNTTAGVDIEVEGPQDVINKFIRLIESELPPLASIDSLDVSKVPQLSGYTDFDIIHSDATSEGYQPISPDVSICPDCQRELLDPNDRRYRYPFINCTNCGPRFTIIKDIPYDRNDTTMQAFDMCPSCEREYNDPLDRRFHAQPVACPECGPNVWIEYSPQYRLENRSMVQGESAIQEVRKLLANGKIVAIKGLGGFHLACDARNLDAVSELRRRKLRVDKPFALMMPDIDTVSHHCYLNDFERELLESRERPIVLLWRRKESDVVSEIAPGQDTIGVMLPYTPLHSLLFDSYYPHELDRLEEPHPHPELTSLVMTSGNISEEPIAKSNSDARVRLSTLADVFLMHNRDIFTRCDDSVVRVFPSEISKELTGNHKTNRKPQVYPIRRSRGYSPFPVKLPFLPASILATGAELKNAFCVTKDQYAFLSQHIGDMENYETLESFEKNVEHYIHLFRVQLEGIAYDLHPNYMATRYALERAETDIIPAIGVQHHHAHVASCMADNGLDGDDLVIGVSFDGTGYGDDGAIWGGEFLLANYLGYHRIAHLAYVPLPGGDKAIHEPWRTALSWLKQCDIEWENDIYPVLYASKRYSLNVDVDSGLNNTNGSAAVSDLDVIRRQLDADINTPLTSSMGRLFDAVSALIGLRQVVNYEAQAAIELETLVDTLEEKAYQFLIDDDMTIDPCMIFKSVISDIRERIASPVIAARFHNGIANLVLEICTSMRSTHNINRIALSGGVWQNTTLLSKTLNLLDMGGFEVFIHHQVPANDGGIALGQAAIAAQAIK